MSCVFIIKDVTDPKLFVELRKELTKQFGTAYTICLDTTDYGADAIHIKTLLQDLYIVNNDIIQVVNGVVVTCNKS